MQLDPIGEKWSESDDEQTRLHKLKKKTHTHTHTHNFHLNQSLKHTISKPKYPQVNGLRKNVQRAPESDRK